MIADVMPNILTHAPYESVFGLACSCRALSRVPIERAQYEISTRRKISEQSGLGDVTGVVTHYPNGWRLSSRVDAANDHEMPGATNIVYKNNAPVFAYVVGEGIIWTMSLVTWLYCMRECRRGYVLATGWGRCDHVGICEGHVEHGTLVDNWVADKIAAKLRPLLGVPHHIVTADTIRVTVKAMNAYARHIGNGTAECYDGVFRRVPGLLTI